MLQEKPEVPPTAEQGNAQEEPLVDTKPDQDTTPPADKHSESESENSQRSSTDRDFEIVDQADVEPYKDEA